MSEKSIIDFFFLSFSILTLSVILTRNYYQCLQLEEPRLLRRSEPRWLGVSCADDSQDNGSCDTSWFWNGGTMTQSLSRNGSNLQLALTVHYKTMGFIIEPRNGVRPNGDMLILDLPQKFLSQIIFKKRFIKFYKSFIFF